MTADNTEWDFDNLSQQQLSEIIGVDRTTIRNWQLAGMPHNPPAGKGHKASYVGAVSINWHVGHEAAKRNRFDLTPAQEIALGYLLGHFDGTFGKTELKLLMEVLEKAGVNDKTQALLALGYARCLIERLYKANIKFTI